MDAFFAAVEQRDQPELRGLPVLIGHDGPRGVVATASYEARPYGCHSAQPMITAKRRCPQAVVLPVDGDRYRETSRQMFAILDEFSPLVEPLSIDEAFLDLTGTQRSLGEPADVARRLKDRIRSELQLTASIGLAPNKFLAKLASDMNKPDGMTIITLDDIDRVLLPLPVDRLWDVGKATAAKLNEMGIQSIGDLRRLSMDRMQHYFGSDAERYYNLIRGVDDRPVVPDREAKSIGHEQTFSVDLADPDEVRRVLLDQVQQVARRLRKHGLAARGISLKLRYGDFQTITRSVTLPAATELTAELWQAARDLFDRWPFQPVRLIGVTAERLSKSGEPLELFPNPERERQRKLDSLTDQINEKFGKRTIQRGGAG